MGLKATTTHVVIGFAGSYPPGQKREVDLVPASWLKNVKGKWTCKYPPEKDYSKRTNWTKKSRQPNPEWLAWKVTIIKEAKNYDEGVRRLQRSYDTSNVESTSAADDSSHEASNRNQQLPTVLDKHRKNRELQQAPSIEETIIEHEAAASGSNNANPSLHESSTSIDDSSEVDENEQTLIHYTQSSPSLSKRTNLQRPALDADKSSDERGSSPPPRDGRIPQHSVVLDDTSSSDDQRPSPPPKKKRRSSQHPVDVAPETNNNVQPRPHVPSVTQESLDNMEKRILKKIESAKRSVLYDVNVKVEQLKNTMVLNSGTTGMNIVENRKCLNIELPVHDPVAFEKFDMALRTAPDKEKALKCIMTTAMTGIDSGTKAVTNILKSVLGKPVQEVYSGCGRTTKGSAKKNFSSTKTYSCMQDVVCDKHNISKKSMLSVTSRWLSGCVDRDGGRVRSAARGAPAMPIVPASQAAPVVPPVPAAQVAPSIPTVPVNEVPPVVPVVVQHPESQ